MKERIPCGLVIPRQGSKVLMLRRSAHDKSFPGRWCFPGGRVEPTDVDAVETALRELYEETRLICMSLRSFHSAESVTESCLYEIEAFLIEVGEDRKVILSAEHQEFRWVSPSEGLQLELAGEVTRTLLEML